MTSLVTCSCFLSSALQAATILLTMASENNIWRLKFWRKLPIGDQQISIGNSMTCSGIWQYYREWYFKIVQNCEWYLENFEILQAGIIAKYYVQVMLLFF